MENILKYICVCLVGHLEIMWVEFYHVKRKYWSVLSSKTTFSIAEANFALRMRRGNLS